MYACASAKALKNALNQLFIVYNSRKEGEKDTECVKDIGGGGEMYLFPRFPLAKEFRSNASLRAKKAKGMDFE